jgi:hypothetical protein
MSRCPCLFIRQVQHRQRRWLLDVVILDAGPYEWHSLVGAACAKAQASLTRQLCEAGSCVLVGAPGLRDPLVLVRERSSAKHESDNINTALLTHILKGMVSSSHARLRLYLANRLGLKGTE